MVLKHVRLRTSFANCDTGGGRLQMLACCDYYAHVLQGFTDSELEACISVGTGVQNYADSTIISTYKECQIHGEVNLAKDVAAFVINSDFKHDCSMLKKLEKLNAKHGVPVLWMDEVEPSQISQFAELERQHCLSPQARDRVSFVDFERAVQLAEEERKRSEEEAERNCKEARLQEQKCSSCTIS